MAGTAPAFIWYELMTTDADAAAAFYGAVIGWQVTGHADPQAGGIDYRHIIRSDGGSNGGVLGLTPAMCEGGAHPCWVPYLYTADVDGKIAVITAEGGRLLMPASDLPVGRIAMVADPQGVPIYLMTPIPPAGKPDARSDVFAPEQPQHVQWNELASPDQDASIDFYRRHFGFEFNRRMPMGDMGDYCFIEHGGQTLGAIMRQQNAGQPAGWLMYFGVPSIRAAKAAIETNGGTVMTGPHQVPDGSWIVVAKDPQGAVFGCSGPE